MPPELHTFLTVSWALAVGATALHFVLAAWSIVWPRVPARITFADATLNTNSPAQWQVFGSFEYTVNGRSYLSNRLRFGGVFFRSEAAATGFALSLRSGGSWSAYYCPHFQSLAVLQPGLQNLLQFLAVAVFLAVLGSSLLSP